MKLSLFIIALVASSQVIATPFIDDEIALQNAISAINKDSQIIFATDAEIRLSQPITYNGNHAITWMGNGATIDGSAIAGNGTLIFNTAADISLQNISIENSATSGVVINIPKNSNKQNIKIDLNHINIINSALHGLHINDGQKSISGVDLMITHSNFLNNGTKAIDFDGIRIDERQSGDIIVLIKHSHFDNNGGDGIELDERGDGNVDATIEQTTMNNNGYFTQDDPEDGFDVDETGSGDIKISLRHVQAKKNNAEGLDFDEAGKGDIELYLNHVITKSNNNEGIKANEKNAGDLFATLKKIKVVNNDNDGIQFTEIEQGKITLFFNDIISHNNKKHGIIVEQWLNKDEEDIREDSGTIWVKKLSLKKNGKGGKKIKVHNVNINPN